MATGLGKTYTFTSIPRRGRVLVLAHREELIFQTAKYYNCPVGIEMADYKSDGEEVVIASVQSIVRRLDKFNKHEFDMIIIDECHHAGALTYKKILQYFKPRLILGFTATPNRGDKVRLDDVFEKIIFQRDLKWAIKNKFLSDIHCLRVDINYDLSRVSRRLGDYATNELENAINTDVLNKAIAETYKKHAKGQTLIFATSISHAKNIANEIDGAIAVTSETKNRSEIIKRFTNRKIPVLVNCMIFTEGTDMPLVETVIIARPTQNESLYQQMVGRGLRLHKDKEKLILIDLVGVVGKVNICTAPSLLGIDLQNVPKKKQKEIQGNLFDLPNIIEQFSDCPESWIKNVEYVNLWANDQSYSTHNLNWFLHSDGSFSLSLPKNQKIIINAQDDLGKTTLSYINQTSKELPIDMPLNQIITDISMQEAFDLAYKHLINNHKESEYIWNLSKTKYWASQPASFKQLNLINKIMKNFDMKDINKFEASQILNRLIGA